MAKTCWILLYYNPPKSHRRWNLQDSTTVEQQKRQRLVFATDFFDILVCVQSPSPLVHVRTKVIPLKTIMGISFVHQSEFYLHLLACGRYGFGFQFLKARFIPKDLGSIFFVEKKRETFSCFLTNLIGPIKNNLLEHQTERETRGICALKLCTWFYLTTRQ